LQQGSVQADADSKQADAPSGAAEVRRALEAIDGAAEDADAMRQLWSRLVDQNAQMADLYQKLSGAVAALRVREAMQPNLLDAIKQMQEMQMSFNLQYLQLQSQMQQENRVFTTVSNIMKTKHDTAKNSISNIR